MTAVKCWREAKKIFTFLRHKARGGAEINHEPFIDVNEQRLHAKTILIANYPVC